MKKPKPKDFKFNRWIGLVWGNALKDAIDREATIVIGHTHVEADLECKGVRVINLPAGRVVELEV